MRAGARITGLAIVALGVLSFNLNTSRAAVELPISAETVEEKTQLLLNIRETIPWLFEEGAEYDVDFFALLQTNDQLVKALQENDLFKQLSPKKGSLREINILQKRRAGKREKVLKASAMNLLAQETFGRLREFYAEWGEARVGTDQARLFRSELGSRLASELRTEPLPDVRKMIEGLVSLLESADRQKIFRESSPEERLKALERSNLTNAVVKAKFKAEVHGLDPKLLGMPYLFSQVRTGLSRERYILRECLAGWALYRFLKHSDQNFENWLAQESSSGMDWLNRGLMTEEVEEFLRKAAPGAEDLVAAFRAANNGFKVDNTVIVRADHQSERHLFRLVEVPPLLGIFRGLVGGDCSTSFSFPFAYMPTESTFFIYDADDELKGYAMLTDVNESYDGKTRDWYLHDVTGSRLSPQDVPIIVHGLMKASKRLGYGHLILATEQRITANNNHKSLIAAQVELLQGGAHVNLSYSDGPLRRGVPTLGVAVHGDYDYAEGNKTGVAITENTVVDSLDAELSLAPPMNLSARRLSPGQALLLSLDLLTSERMEASRVALQEAINDVAAGGFSTNKVNYALRRTAAAAIAEGAGIDFRSVMALSEQLKNSSKLPLASYYEGLREGFKVFAVDLNDDLIDGRPYLFYEGHLNAQDAHTADSSAMSRRTLEFALAMFKRWPQSPLALKVVSSGHAIFTRQSKFQNYIRFLIKGGEGEWRQLQQIYLSKVPMDFLEAGDLDVLEQARERLSDSELRSLAAEFAEKIRINIERHCEKLLTAS